MDKIIETTVSVFVYLLIITTVAVLVFKLLEIRRRKSSKEVNQKNCDILLTTLESSTQETRPEAPSETNVEEDRQTSSLVFKEGGFNAPHYNNTSQFNTNVKYPELFSFNAK